MPTILGTLGNDLLLGTNFDDEILALAGFDTIIAAGGADIVLGDQDADSLDGGAGNDTVFGGKGNDTIIGGVGFDLLIGNDGDDSIVAGIGLDLVFGDAGNDSIFTDEGEDQVFGGPGNDLISTGSGKDIVRGGRDNDQIFGNSDADSLFGDLGADSIYGGQDVDSIRGGKGDDFLSGDFGNDTILGDIGQDFMLGGEGDDSLFGGNTSTAEDGNDTIFGEGGNDHIFSQAGNDILSGGIGNDIVNGGAGSDAISGDAGNDSLYGGDGVNTLTGGEGRDLFLLQPGPTSQTAAGAEVILDFTDGVDVIGLAPGITFDNLVITLEGNNTVIRQRLQAAPTPAPSPAPTPAPTTLPGAVYAVLAGVNPVVLTTSDFITLDQNAFNAIAVEFTTPTPPTPPTPTPTPTPPTPTPTPGGGAPRIVGGEVLVANNSTPANTTLATLTATGASTFALTNAVSNTGQAIPTGTFTVEGNSLRLSNSNIFGSGIGAVNSVTLTLEARNAGGTVLGTTQVRVYGSIDDATGDSALGDSTDISSGGQNTILVASGTYDNESLASSLSRALRFPSADNTTLVLNNLSRLQGPIARVLPGTSAVDTRAGGTGNDLFIGGGEADNFTGGGGSNAYVYRTSSEGGATGDNISDFTTNDRIYVNAAGFGSGLAAGSNISSTQFIRSTAAVEPANPAASANNTNARFVYDQTTGTLYFDQNGNASGGGSLLVRLPANLQLENTNIVVF